MTKLITVTSIRHGAGKTTVASILAERLAEKYSVCLIDNNTDNINVYSEVSSIESIHLYTCLADMKSCCRAIKESAAVLKKNLYFFSGGNSLLTEKEIQILKEQDIFDYIIFDSGVEISDELPDFIITVVNPNVFEYEIATKDISMRTGIRFIGETFESMIIINRYTENTEFKVNAKDFKLYFCPEIINFVNGYKLNLSEVNEKEIKKLIDRITGEKSENMIKNKFKLFGRSKHGI